MCIKRLSSIVSCIALVFIVLTCGNFEGNIEELRPINIDITVTASNRALTLTWNAVKNATGYEVYYNRTSAVAVSPNFRLSGSRLSQTISGLENGITYYCWVKVICTDGRREESSVASGKPVGNMGTVTVTTGEIGELILDWPIVAGADEYEIYYAANSVRDINSADFYRTVSNARVVLSGLANGTNYNVWVKPKNANGYGNTSPMVIGKTLVTLEELAVIAADQQVTVSWEQVPDATGYNAYYSTSASMPASPEFANVAELSQTITGLANGTTYHFWITALFADGMISNPSPRASGKPIGNMETVAVTAGESGELVLNWPVVMGADEYEIYYATNMITHINDANLYRTVSDASATISGLANGVDYNVWVKPKNANGYGNESPMASGRTLAAPEQLTVTVANQQVTVSWGQVPDATDYNVYYGTDTSMPDSPVFTNVTELTKTISGLVNGTTYNFWVTAVFASGIISGPSPQASGTPLDIPNPAVSSAYKQLLVEWASVDGAIRYDVYYSTGNSRPESPVYANITGLSQEIPGLDNGTTYYIWVKARNDSTDSNDASPMASGIPGNIIPGLYQGARHIGNQDLDAALAYISSNAVDNDDYYIVLGANESISNKDLQYSDRTVGITLLGHRQQRTINLDADAAMFFINHGVTLTLGENIILKGRSANNYSLVCLDGGNLILNNGAKITGNKADLGGGVFIAAGNLTMNGGTISGNTANRGGGVYVSAGNFTMSGGIINGNRASSFGGGVYIDNGAFQKQPSGASEGNSGIIYGNDAVGNDADGIQYANTASTSGAAVYKSWYPRSSVFRDTTAGQADHIGY